MRPCCIAIVFTWSGACLEEALRCIQASFRPVWKKKTSPLIYLNEITPAGDPTHRAPAEKCRIIQMNQVIARRQCNVIGLGAVVANQIAHIPGRMTWMLCFCIIQTNLCFGKTNESKNVIFVVIILVRVAWNVTHFTEMSHLMYGHWWSGLSDFEIESHSSIFFSGSALSFVSVKRSTLSGWTSLLSTNASVWVST